MTVPALSDRTRPLRHALPVWSTLAILAGAAGGTAANPAPGAGATIEVRPGDTFSAIAARHAVRGTPWRSMYRPDATGLRSPDRITVGMRFELVNDARGPYLRLVSPQAAADGSAAERPAARSATSAAATTPAPGGASAAAGAPGTAGAASSAVTGSAAAGTASAASVGTTAGAGASPTPAGVPPPVGDAGTLVVGVLPNIPAATLQTQYAHLRNYLERAQGQSVRIVVPSSFKAFFDGTMQGAYDLAVSAPHFARVAQADRGMVPLVMYEPRINALFVAPLEAPVSSPRDVRERVVAFANPTSLVAMYGQQWLRQAGLEPGQDYAVKGVRTDLGVGRMLLTGEATAAIMSNGEFRALPVDESGRLKVVETFARIPNFVVLGHPRVGRERLAKIKADLKDFFADKDDGAAFRQATGIAAIVDADESQLRELDAYTAQTRRAMGHGQ